MKINLMGIKNNIHNFVGVIVGKVYLKRAKKRFPPLYLGNVWFSHVAANNAANGLILKLFPHTVFYK